MIPDSLLVRSLLAICQHNLKCTTVHIRVKREHICCNPTARYRFWLQLESADGALKLLQTLERRCDAVQRKANRFPLLLLLLAVLGGSVLLRSNVVQFIRLAFLAVQKHFRDSVKPLETRTTAQLSIAMCTM